ncbi:MAG: hypothetical protein Q8J89_07290 [Caulobacter sp.]|nr:hypothetical protein [Caulobacter sp.]
MRWVMVALVAACVGLAGCSIKPDAEIDALARQVYREIRSDDPALQARLVPQLKTDEAKAEIAKIRAYIPAEDPTAIKPVNWTMTTMTGGQVAFLRHHYVFSDRSAIVQSRLVRPNADGPWQVEAFHIQLATEAETAVNDFNLLGKPIGQLAFLALVILSPLLMVAALVRVIRSKGLRLKWLWGIVAFVGLFSFQMNWTTGQLGIQWLSIQIIGFGITSTGTGFDPWVLACTVPVGALLILAGVWAKPAKVPPSEATF